MRLKDFDYRSRGAYFVTVSLHERAGLLGSLDGAAGGVRLNDAGKMIDRWWRELPQKFQTVILDAYTVMPDHFHGIVFLGCGVAEVSQETVSLSTAIQWFKTMTTAEYFRGVHEGRWRRVDRRLWQRGFYDHIIRTERDLIEIRDYIERNPGALFERFAGRTHRCSGADT
jgi:REP element-mobilizing transposase RayT